MRRNKKQPEYDPNELADLIATPAVGKGVGSHLIAPTDDIEVTTVVTIEPASVASSLSTPVDTKELSPIVPGRKPFPALPADALPTPVETKVENQVDSVVESEMTTVAESERQPVVNCLEDISKATTVATSQDDLLGRLWISESGEIVPQSRVRRIAAVSDALSSGEQALYKLLWNSPAVRETPGTRSIQAGYDSLTKRTGFSRKTIQRTIDRLIAKYYIEIETQADIYRRTPTIYRVFADAAVLERLARHNRTHVAKIGPGVAFVTPLVTLGDHPDTVVISDLSTIATTSVSTVDHS